MSEINQDIDVHTALRRKNARNPNYVTHILSLKRTELLPKIRKEELSILANTAAERSNVKMIEGRVEGGNADELVLLLAWNGTLNNNHNRPQSLSRVLDLVKDLASRNHYSIESHYLFAGGPGYQGYPEFMSFYVRPAHKELFEHAFADFESTMMMMSTAVPQACLMTGGD
ncbi:hypothetical protein SI65_05989 [Aspergillus cristatus]|uniref:Uncharacterized protein n=1 Tax=Aspergillus cristatus TaxID=573508 RepID=A0A1E3BF07_ASPCR|nr:hypothetical protein SI65_05989 [Aspergillus cristatus]